MSETRLVGDCLAWLKLRGVFAWRNNTGAAKYGRRVVRYGCPGSPDILACHNGHFLGIECKVGSNGQSPLQERWQRDFEAAGGQYYLIRTLADLQANW